MKGVVVYQSRNGSTKQYAAWLAEETGFDLLPVKKAGRLDGYDVVVLGSCIIAQKPSMAAWIVKRWPLLRDRKTVLFTVAGAPKADQQRQDWVQGAIGAEIMSKLPHVALDGKMIFAELTWLDRKLMGMAIKMTAKSDPDKAREMAKEFDGVKRADLALIKSTLTSLGVRLPSV